MEQVKVLLDETEMPRQWYNVQADLPTPLAPPFHPATMEIATPEQMNVIFPMSLLEQEMSPQAYWDIPDEVMQVLALWRPTPLQRARGLEKALGTPARIYFKNESVSPAGSHKPNTAVAQAYYNKQEGIKRIATETGAGQWGSAMSLACNMFGLECTVYMVRVSYDQKPYRKSIINTWGPRSSPAPASRPTRAARPWPKTPTTPAPWAWPSARRWKTRPPATTPTTPWARCSTTCACTRPSSARKPSAR